MTSVESILSAASQLPEAERVRVIESLLETFEPAKNQDPHEIEEAWRVEVVRRSEELRSGKVKSVPWSAVRADGERLLDGDK